MVDASSSHARRYGLRCAVAAGALARARPRPAARLCAGLPSAGGAVIHLIRQHCGGLRSLPGDLSRCRDGIAPAIAAKCRVAMANRRGGNQRSRLGRRAQRFAWELDGHAVRSGVCAGYDGSNTRRCIREKTHSSNRSLSGAPARTPFRSNRHSHHLRQPRFALRMRPWRPKNSC